MHTDSRYPHPVEVVKQEYARPENVASFGSDPVWGAEKLLVEKYFKPGDSILDIACGAGRTAIYLARQGCHVTGFDFLPEMLESARERTAESGLDVKLVQMDATAMMFSDESFDGVVFFYNSFELIWGRANRVRLLKDVYDILQPGGIFLLTARSGLAYDRRIFVWPWLLLRSYVLRPLGVGNPYLESGDVFSRGTYHRWQSPFGIKRDLREAGFVLEAFNSRRRIEQGRPPGFLTHFSNDKALFFVARKPG